MFLRRYHRTVAGKVTHVLHPLRERAYRGRAAATYRTHLGELSAAEESRWQRTVAFPNRQGVVQHTVSVPGRRPCPFAGRSRYRAHLPGYRRLDQPASLWRYLVGLRPRRRLRLEEIVNRHVPQGKRTVLPATVAAIEVINRLCAPRSKLLREKKNGTAKTTDAIVLLPCQSFCSALGPDRHLSYGRKGYRPACTIGSNAWFSCTAVTPLPEFTCRGPGASAPASGSRAAPCRRRCLAASASARPGRASPGRSGRRRRSRPPRGRPRPGRNPLPF